MPTDIDEIHEFLNSRGVKAVCPRCDTRNWVLNREPSPWAGFWGANRLREFSLDSPIYEVILLVCDNCGFVSPHSRVAFDKWKKQRHGKSE
jgi:hypothetical protein